MELAEGIRKHGFRRWHERELISSHGWLVTSLLTALISFAALELALQDRGPVNQLMNGLIALVAGGVTLLTLYRFLAGLVRAQKASSQAVCARCGTFGRLALVAEDRAATWVRVRCRECSQEWVIEND